MNLLLYWKRAKEFGWHKNLHTDIHSVVFIMAERQKQPSCASADGGYGVRYIVYGIFYSMPMATKRSEG